MHAWIGQWLGVLALSAALAACGGRAPAGDGDGQDQIARGQTVFAENCMACHGEGATGADTGPPLVHEYYEPSHHGDDAFRSAINDGVVPHHWTFGPMPPVPGLSDEDVDVVIAYVRSLQQEAGIE